MKKLISIAIIIIPIYLLFALATPVYAAIISEPSFETVSNWTYEQEDADYAGAQSSVWSTQSNNSYLLSSAGGGMIANKKHAHLYQSMDFTSVDTISFDARLSAGSNGYYEATVEVGGVTVWTQSITTTQLDYLHQEVDVSGYSGVQTFHIHVETVATANSITVNAYFDNIKIWGSYSSGRTTVINDFTTYEDIVYMYGENFDTTGTYKIAYYDGGTAHDGADGTKVETDGPYTDDSDGILDPSQCRPADYGSSSYGTWNAVIYKTTGTMPVSYDLVSKSDSAYVITDSFYVQPEAIPEFPSVVAGIVVAGMCFGFYYWMRERRLAHVKT